MGQGTGRRPQQESPAVHTDPALSSLPPGRGCLGWPWARHGSPDVFVGWGLGAVGGGDARRQVFVSAPLYASDIHKVPGGGRVRSGGAKPKMQGQEACLRGGVWWLLT